MPENQSEIPDWLKEISQKAAENSSNKPPEGDDYRLGPNPEGFKRFSLGSKRLTEILLSPDSQAAFAELLEQIGGITKTQRGLFNLAVDISSELAEKVAAKHPFFKEKSFFIYGSVRDEKYVEVSPVSTGLAMRASPGPEVISVHLGETFDIFDAHSEPGHLRSDRIEPSVGDYDSSSARTQIYHEEGWTIKPIAIAVHPDNGKAVIFQKKRLGYRKATVDFPFKAKELGKALNGFNIRIDRTK